MTQELLLILMLVALCGGLLSGYPVAFVLSGTALLFALVGHQFDLFDLDYISAFPDRVFGIMMNDLLLAVPLFVFMGVMLERARIAEDLLTTMAGLFKRFHGGMALSVILVGALLGASTGIVGATVVTMGLISLPAMLNSKYSHAVATGTICAAGTLGQIIPPSIVLILLGDQISSAHQNAQMQLGNLSPEPVSLADLFVGALVPSLVLVGLYLLWIILYGAINPKAIPPHDHTKEQTTFTAALKVLIPPLLLILLVLGSILAGIATATEAASVGAVGSILLTASYGRFCPIALREVCRETTLVTSMIFTILIGAALFSLVFRGFGGDDMVHHLLDSLPGGLFLAMLTVMIVMFLLGFFLDFIEIIFVVVPIVAPVLLLMGADPVWLAIMIAMNLQTSFLTPPFGFSLFYLRGVAPRKVKTTSIYKGVIPFVALQLVVLCLIAAFPPMATWLPHYLYKNGAEATPVTPGSLEFVPAPSIDF